MPLSNVSYCTNSRKTSNENCRKLHAVYDNYQNMYRLSISWKEDKPRLPENYSMALQRLQNTEKETAQVTKHWTVMQ